MEIGPVPYEENCAQLGDEYFHEKSKKEMNAYIEQLYRQFPEAANNRVAFVSKWFSHDFGSYGEVCIKYNDENQLALEYALMVEKNLPGNWDEEAIKELELDIKK